MTKDTSVAARPTVTPRGTGPGQAPHFNCPACAKPKPMLGRVARRMYGLRTFVCADCKGKAR